ncbi:hypothetical protein TWF281_003058 [Arthrobotrys megalospora]
MSVSSSGTKPSSKLMSLPVEVHEHILSFLPNFDTLFLASKAIPLWQTIFNTRFLSSAQYTPPEDYGIAGAHQIFYGVNADFMCIVENGVIHRIFLQYDTGTELDITNDPILDALFWQSEEARNAIYPCVLARVHPTRVRRHLRKPNPYARKIYPSVYHIDEFTPGDTIRKVVLNVTRRHIWELPQDILRTKYRMEIGPIVRNRAKPSYSRQGLEAFFRGEEKE